MYILTRKDEPTTLPYVPTPVPSPASEVSLTPISEPEIAELNFSESVTALGTASENRTAPFSGYIRKVTISWPDGCDNLVQVIFNHKTVQILPYPSREGLALTGTHTFDLNHHVKQGDTIEMYLINNDYTFSHAITAVVQLAGE